MEKTNSLNIKYFFIGNVELNKTLHEIVLQKNEKSNSECKKIFESMIKLKENSFEQRNKIASGETVYFFIVKKNVYLNSPIFFFLETKSNYPERNAFELIDEIVTQNLVKEDSSKIRSLLEKHQQSNLMDNIARDVNEIKIDMNNTIQSQIRNLDNLKDLKDRSDNIKLGADSYKKDARNLKWATCWQNLKWTIIILAALILLILVIVIPIFLSKKSEEDPNATK